MERGGLSGQGEEMAWQIGRVGRVMSGISARQRDARATVFGRATGNGVGYGGECVEFSRVELGKATGWAGDGGMRRIWRS